MKQFFTVFEFELMNFVKSKSFIIATILIAVLLGGATFLPRFIDMSEMLGIESAEKNDDKEEDKEDRPEEKEQLVIYDKSGYFADLSLLSEAFADAEFKAVKSEAEVKKAVESEEADAGFYVIDDLHYRY